MSAGTSNPCAALPTTPADLLTAEAAQLFCQFHFTKDFIDRHPGGIVISERDHVIMGHRNSQLDRILLALEKDFRSHKGVQDWRKPDALGLSADGTSGELMEVTTADRYRARRDRSHIAVQLRDKLDTLNRTVNINNGLHTRWQATNWRIPAHIRCPLAPRPGFVCYQPTYCQQNLESGICLYEVHTPLGPPLTVPVPMHVPKTVRQKITRALGDIPDFTGLHPLPWAQNKLRTAPDLTSSLRNLQLLAGPVLLLATLTAILSVSAISLAALALLLALEQTPVSESRPQFL